MSMMHMMQWAAGFSGLGCGWLGTVGGSCNGQLSPGGLCMGCFSFLMPVGFGLVGGPDRAGPRVMLWQLRGGVGIPSGSLLKHACQLGCLVGAFGAELKCRPDRVHHRAERLFPSLSFPWLCIPALACTYDVHGSSWAARSRYASQFYQPSSVGMPQAGLCVPPLRCGSPLV
jgi:hypothetical protein